MKKILTIAFILSSFFILEDVQAQHYESAVGVRAGWGLTGTYKTFFNESNAAEAYLGIGWGGFTAGAMYQIHNSLEELDIPNLDWYFGGGAYAGTYNSYGFGANYFFLGINAVVGLDYTFDDYPVNLSVDFAPGINLLRGEYVENFLHFATGGLAIRYILGD